MTCLSTTPPSLASFSDAPFPKRIYPPPPPSLDLQHATLDGKYLGRELAYALAEALKVNTNLRRLDADRNNFGDVGVLAIADALKVNKTLRVITLIGIVTTWGGGGGGKEVSRA